MTRLLVQDDACTETELGVLLFMDHELAQIEALEEG